MMLDRVTITGADDNTDIISLAKLSQEHLFVEWGVLISKRMCGNGRFPSYGWINELKAVAAGNGMHLSAHLCGKFVRDLLAGNDTLPGGLIDGFERVQLNFHDEKCSCDYRSFATVLQSYCDIQWIFQIDETRGARHLSEAIALGVNAVPLFDRSGGLGKLPESWPAPPLCYHGYAGSLSPENVAEQIKLIRSKLPQGVNCWVDVETNVRTDDEMLDMHSVRAFIDACAPFVDGKK